MKEHASHICKKKKKKSLDILMQSETEAFTYLRSLFIWIIVLIYHYCKIILKMTGVGINIYLFSLFFA